MLALEKVEHATFEDNHVDIGALAPFDLNTPVQYHLLEVHSQYVAYDFDEGLGRRLKAYSVRRLHIPKLIRHSNHGRNEDDLWRCANTFVGHYCGCDT